MFFIEEPTIDRHSWLHYLLQQAAEKLWNYGRFTFVAIKRGVHKKPERYLVIDPQYSTHTKQAYDLSFDHFTRAVMYGLDGDFEGIQGWSMHGHFHVAPYVSTDDIDLANMKAKMFGVDWVLDLKTNKILGVI